MTKKSDSHQLKSVQYLLENNFSEAIKELDKVIEIDPKDSVSQHNRGACKFNLDQFEEAIKDFDKVIELNPDHPKSWNCRGRTRYCLNQFAEAIKDLDKAIEINPNYFVAYENRAGAKRKLGDD